MSPRREQSIRLVGAVYEAFGGYPQPLFLRYANHFTACEGIEYQHRIKIVNGGNQCLRQVRIARGHIVQGTVGLHVMEPAVRGFGKTMQRPDLVKCDLVNLIGGYRPFVPAKALQVWQPRMCPYGNAMTQCGGHGERHPAGIAGMESARNVGRRNILQECLVR